MKFDKLTQYASHFFKQECMRARLEVFQNESGGVGVDFILKTKSGKFLEIDLRVINLEETLSIKISKSDWNYEQPENRLVAFVGIMKDIDPAVYLIPCKDFGKDKNDRILIDNTAQSERFAHYGNWEIKMFRNAAKEFNDRYGWANVVSTFQ
jgi:hypothetical protein